MAVAVALLATLAACGGSSHAADPSSPVPITTTPVRSTGTTSASPTLDPNSDAAIIAGVRAWADALTLATNTASLAPLISAATSRCSCIQGEEKAISYLVINKLRLTTKYSISSVRIINHAGGAATVVATVSSPAYKVLRADGSVLKTENGDSSSSQYSMKRIGSRWLVDTVI